MLKAYLDGSGVPADPNCRFVTLAGVYADAVTWGSVETRWRAVLAKYDAAYSHMRELLGSRRAFTKWDEAKKCNFVRDLLVCMMAEQLNSNFFAASVTVALDDYRAMVAEHRNIKPVQAVCVDCCMTYAFRHPEFESGKAEVFFDKGEGFLQFAEFVWSRKRRYSSSWAARVTTLTSADMHEAIPLQIADLLAWSSNRQYTSEDRDFWGSLHIRSTFSFLRYFHSMYGREELMTHPGINIWTGKPVA